VNRRRVRALLRKEWIELTQNRTLVGSAIALPVLLAGCMISMSMVIEGQLGAGEANDLADLPGSIPPALAGVSPELAMLNLLNDQFLVMLLYVPALLPLMVTTFAIVGEKRLKSLEPLLSTPVTTRELLVAKSVAAIVPAALVCWATYLVVVIGFAIGSGPEVFAWIVRPAWLIGMGLLGPLLAVVAAFIGVIASTKTQDPRLAQSSAGLLILPLMAWGSAVMLGWVWVDVRSQLITVAGLAVASYVLLRLSVALFDREVILTQWD
jgi:ABC-2 type transport system permease protein